MIWPFKSKSKEKPRLPQLEDLRFGFDNSMWQYTPAEDIAPYEVALLIPLFINVHWRADYGGWINKNNLRRHFTKVEK